MSAKILLIEDNGQDRKVLMKYLTRAGFTEIFEASNSEEALQIAREKRPQIVLSDTALPGDDGFETCKRILALDGFKTKIIIMTGLIDTVDATKAKEIGVAEYCVKTADWSIVLKAVKKVSKSL